MGKLLQTLNNNGMSDKGIGTVFLFKNIYYDITLFARRRLELLCYRGVVTT